MKKLILFITMCLFLSMSSNAFADDDDSSRSESGFQAQVGVGYATIAAFIVAPSVGYAVNKYFTIQADSAFKFGEVPSFGFQLTLTPRLTFTILMTTSHTPTWESH